MMQTFENETFPPNIITLIDDWNEYVLKSFTFRLVFLRIFSMRRKKEGIREMFPLQHFTTTKNQFNVIQDISFPSKKTSSSNSISTK